jgi:hypothetical protein
MGAFLSILPCCSSPPSIRVEDVDVDHQFNCPNFQCTLATPHTYQNLLPLPPCPRHVPQLFIQRFDSANHPFPRTNRWEVAVQPRFPLVQDYKVYVHGYGVVKLKESSSTAASWKVFQCLNIDGKVITEVVAKEEWCEAGRVNAGGRNPFSFTCCWCA